MKVALVHDILTQFGGAERVLLKFTKMFPEAPIYTLVYDKKLDKWFGDKKIITSGLQSKYDYFGKYYKFWLGSMPTIIEQFDLHSYDLVISDSNSFAKGVLTGPDTFHLCYTHSPTRYLWDWTHEYIREQNLNWLMRILLSLQLHKLRQWDRVAADRVDEFVANSKNVAERIKKYYRREAKVVYPPVPVNEMRPQKKEDYFLVLGRLSKYKRNDLAVTACRELDLPLKVVGTGPELENLKKMAGPKTEFLGFVTDDELKDLRAEARALIFAGEEDFGMVMVEVIASGTPVIAYEKGGALEIIEEGVSGLFFGKPNLKSLKDALQRFLDMENKFLPNRIKQTAEKFSEQNFEKSIKEVIRSHVQ